MNVKKRNKRMDSGKKEMEKSEGKAEKKGKGGRRVLRGLRYHGSCNPVYSLY